MRMSMGKMPKTVYERMKLNGGLIAGPNHKGSNKRIMQAMEEGDTPEGEGPPNLRDAERMDTCATCTHYAGQKCQKYDVDVTPNEICDAWTKVGAAGPDEMDAETEGTEEEDD